MKNDVYLQHFDLFYIVNNIHRSVEGELFINLKLFFMQCKEITFKDIINALDANVLSNVYFNTRGDDDVMIRLIDNSLWSKMSSYLQEYAESITLAQLCDEYIKNNEIEHNIPMYYI